MDIFCVMNYIYLVQMKICMKMKIHDFSCVTTMDDPMATHDVFSNSSKMKRLNHLFNTVKLGNAINYTRITKL